MELALLFKVEFWRVNFWRLLVSPPNPPKYSPTKILRYTVFSNEMALSFNGSGSSLLLPHSSSPCSSIPTIKIINMNNHVAWNAVLVILLYYD